MSTQYMRTAPAFAGGSPISDLLDMIARRAPLMMRAGGGPIPREDIRYGSARKFRRLSQDETARIVSIIREGKCLMEVAQLAGCAAGTVRRVADKHGLTIARGQQGKPKGGRVAA